MRPVYLLDTNVISELVKPTPNSSVLEKLIENGKYCAICSTVWQESVYGYERMPEGKRKNKVATYLARIKGSYDIIPYDTFASQICGELQSACERKSRIY